MRKNTIAEMREKALFELIARKTDTPTEQDIASARRTMNSFYRLCGQDEQLLYLENNERTCNSRYTAEKSARRDKWLERLNKVFKEEYKAQLIYFGYLPTICAKDSTQDLYLIHFYN